MGLIFVSVIDKDALYGLWLSCVVDYDAVLYGFCCLILQHSVTNKNFKGLNVNGAFLCATVQMLPFRMGHDTEDAIITLLQKFKMEFFFLNNYKI